MEILEPKQIASPGPPRCYRRPFWACPRYKNRLRGVRPAETAAIVADCENFGVRFWLEKQGRVLVVVEFSSYAELNDARGIARKMILAHLKYLG